MHCIQIYNHNHISLSEQTGMYFSLSCSVFTIQLFLISMTVSVIVRLQ